MIWNQNSDIEKRDTKVNAKYSKDHFLKSKDIFFDKLEHFRLDLNVKFFQKGWVQNKRDLTIIMKTTFAAITKT